MCVCVCFFYYFIFIYLFFFFSFIGSNGTSDRERSKCLGRHALFQTLLTDKQTIFEFENRIYPKYMYSDTLSRAVEIPCSTRQTCPISLITSKEFQFTSPATRTSHYENKPIQIYGKFYH